MNSTALARTFDENDEVADSGFRETLVFRRIRRSIELVTEDGVSVVRAPKTAPVKETRPIPKIPDVFLRTFQLLQQWEGQVKQVTGDSFVAVISDKTNLGSDDEEVELDIMEVAPEDAHLVRPGALFYWSVGYEDGRGIPRQRVSRVRFRRLPGLTSRDIRRARESARKFASLFE